MTGVLAIGLFVALSSALGSLLFLLFARFRSRALKTLGVSVIGVIGIGVWLSLALDREANELGFLNEADRQEARKAGISDAKSWAVKREEYASLKAVQAAAVQEEEARQRAEQKAKQAAEEAAREASCLSDLTCIGERFSIEASIACKPWVERLAKNDFQWTDSWAETKLSRYRWGNTSKQQVTYIGDKIKYQNGFGAWIRHVYECDFDVQKKVVVNVRARPGQLPP